MAAARAQSIGGEFLTILTDRVAIVPAAPVETLVLATHGVESNVRLAAIRTVPASARVDPNRGGLESNPADILLCGCGCSPMLLGRPTCGTAASRMADEDGGPGDVKELMSRTPAPTGCGVNELLSRAAATTFGDVIEMMSWVPTLPTNWASAPPLIAALGPSGEAADGAMVGEHEVGALLNAASTILNVAHMSRTACDITSSCC